MRSERKQQAVFMKILIVDDHVVTRQMLDQYLRVMGFTDIDSVATGEDAQKHMERKHYDIVFLDWYMPGKGGFTLMQECREDRRFDDIAFVMVTAESNEKSMIEALKAGATSYIVKPITREAFEEKVARVLNWLKSRGRTGLGEAS
jgi:two-component system chemotaxis response regulator CheY